MPAYDLMGSEDFSFMLEERPGNIMLIGNGDTAGCHDPASDFNDAADPIWRFLTGWD
jgi:metal-dependent amidase/aminoacylase/carboxypeptidase family protein